MPEGMPVICAGLLYIGAAILDCHIFKNTEPIKTKILFKEQSKFNALFLTIKVFNIVEKCTLFHRIRVTWANKFFSHLGYFLGNLSVYTEKKIH